MLRVEFVGIPGIGKSSIFTDVSKRVGKGFHLKENLRREIVIKYCENKSLSFLQRKRLQLFWKNSTPFPNALIREVYKNKNQGSGDFFRYVARTVWTSDAEFERQLNAFRLFQDEYALYESLNRFDVKCNSLLDEHLIQRVFTLLYQKQSTHSSEKVLEYFNLVPVPTHLVFVKLSPEVAVTRIESRYKKTGRINQLEESLSEKELHIQLSGYQKILEKGVQVLENRGVNVLRIDSSHSIESNSKKVVAFLNET